MRTLPRHPALSVSLVALYVLPHAFVVAAQAQPEGVLVIEGATLIDGNGGAPVPDSMIIERGYHANYEVTLDAGALRAVGKFDMVVRNPDPIDPAVPKGMWGNGTSNVAHLIVNYRY